MALSCFNCETACSGKCLSNCDNGCYMTCASYCASTCKGGCLNDCQSTAGPPITTRALEILIKVAQTLNTNTEKATYKQETKHIEANLPKQGDLITKEMIQEYISIARRLYEEKLPKK